MIQQKTFSAIAQGLVGTTYAGFRLGWSSLVSCAICASKFELRFVYAVFEGRAEGRLAEAAELLVAAASDDDGKSTKVLYNSRLRFSDRQYPVIKSLQRLELAAPLPEVASSRLMLNAATADARCFSSAVSKLQMSTFFSRAADLKCHNLFPTDEELRYLRRFVGR